MVGEQNGASSSGRAVGAAGEAFDPSPANIEARTRRSDLPGDLKLAVRIRPKEGVSYGIGSGLNADSLDRLGSFRASAISAPQNAARVEAAFKEEAAR